MRRLFTIIKDLILLSLFISGFVFVWNPFFRPKISYGLSNLTKFDLQSSNKTYLSRISDPVIFDDISVLSTNYQSTAGTQIISSDPRIVAMRQFLIDYHSPLYPYAEVFVVEADKVGLDWRLVASISGVESAFGNLIPYKSNNAWGWKGDPTRDWSYFTSWKVAISTVTERIAIGYGTDITPFTMEAIYCPPCGLNPAHAWANGVTKFMNELESYRQNLE